jgi:hypothetical protein
MSAEQSRFVACLAGHGSVKPGQVMDINPIAVFVASGDSAWLAGGQLLATS